MATVKVRFRPAATEGQQGTIVYHITHERKTRRIITSYHLYPSQWNEKKSMPLVGPDTATSEITLAITRSIHIDIRRIDRIIKSLSDRTIIFDVDEIIDRYNMFMQENSLFRFMESTIQRLRQNGRIRTSETYAATLRSFRKFRRGRDIMFDEFDTHIAEAYQTYLHRAGLIPNSTSFYMRILRAIFNRAVEAGFTEQSHPFRHVYTGIDKTVKRALPLSAISRLRQLNLSHSPSLAFARDMFMLSFYMRGMSFIDMAFLRKSDLRNGHITYRRHKTGQLLSIAWISEMETIVRRYPAPAPPYLLPIITCSGHDELAFYRRISALINRGLKKIATLMGISVPLTLYVARHSWASAARSKGIPLSVISEGMGHDSEATTQIYLSSLDSSVVDRANSRIIAAL